jgi:hypothetical protein
MRRFKNGAVRQVGLSQYLREAVRDFDIMQVFGIPCYRTTSPALRTRIRNLHCRREYGPQSLWIRLITCAVRVENNRNEAYDTVSRNGRTLSRGRC